MKASGTLLGGGALGLGSAVFELQPRCRALPLPAENAARPLYAKEKKRVVVIGGGLAGLAAATELAGRHFDVTLVERAGELGGKLTAWTVRALGEEFPVEHGFHGFFAQYYNLRALLAAAGADRDLAPSPGYPVLFANGAPERFGRGIKTFPFNLVSVVAQSRALKLAEFADDGPALYELMRYDGERTFARFDEVDFVRFAKEGRIHRAMIDTVLAPFGKTTLNRLDRLSAAEAIRFFHFYFMGNPEGLGFSYLTRDSRAAVIEPLAARARALGARILVGKTARQLDVDGDRVARVSFGAAGGARSFSLAAAAVSERWTAVDQPDGSRVFLRNSGDSVVALDGRCSHMGCPLKLDGDGFACPCHGGRFDGEGRPFAGPPKAPLSRLSVRRRGDALVVAEGDGAADDSLPCDYCVVACEVRGLQALMVASDHRLARHVAGLGEADPYVVWRLWLDKPTAPARLPFYTTSRFAFTDSLAIYSAFQEPFVSWARRTGGSVIETHAYAVAPLPPAAELRAAMWRELVAMLPEIAGARILHEEIQQQSNFTRLAPGDHARRPSTATPLANLMLAGDHVRLPAPASLMEAAVMSGRLAANAIFEREGLRQLAIPTVALKGPLA